MVHDIIGLISAVSTGICKVHGQASQECGAAKEAATLGITAIGGAALGSALAGRDGAVAGGLLGFLAGLLINESGEESPVYNDRAPSGETQCGKQKW
jgi:outer membrane lipoprotein SlyB